MAGGSTDSGTSGTGADSTNPQISISLATPQPPGGLYLVTEGVDLNLTIALVRQNGYAGPVPLGIANLPARRHRHVQSFNAQRRHTREHTDHFGVR